MLIDRMTQVCIRIPLILEPLSDLIMTEAVAIQPVAVELGIGRAAKGHGPNTKGLSR
jgi:hypothetical protein